MPLVTSIRSKSAWKHPVVRLLITIMEETIKHLSIQTTKEEMEMKTMEETVVAQEQKTPQQILLINKVAMAAVKTL